MIERVTPQRNLRNAAPHALAGSVTRDEYIRARRGRTLAEFRTVEQRRANDELDGT